jgi:hypothetical protein
VVRIVRVLSREEPLSAADHVADEPGPLRLTEFQRQQLRTMLAPTTRF